MPPQSVNMAIALILGCTRPSDSCTGRYSPNPGTRACASDATTRPESTAARNFTYVLYRIVN